MYSNQSSQHNKATAFLNLNHMLSRLVLGFISYVALMTISHAQTVTVTGNIPYAANLKNEDGSLKVWTMSKIREDKHETVNPIEGKASVMERDSNSLAYKLGDTSETADETKDYGGTLDLTSAVLPATIAILVDDIATLTIEEIPTGNEPAGHTPFTETYKVNGTALWNPKSYKEFPTPLPPGRKYQLDLVYKNNANLTANYPDGKVDIDGVSVYVSLLSVDVRVPKIKWSNDKNEAQQGQFVADAVLQVDGAYVPLNSDDDNYSGIPDMEDRGQGTDLVAIKGPNGELAETDLLPLIIMPVTIDNVSAKFTLDIPSTIRVWRNPDRTDRVRGKNDPGEGDPTEIHVTEETTLYLEGCRVGEEILKLDLKVGSLLVDTAYALKVTVFDIQGPTSVPAEGTYKYKVLGAQGKWIAPVNGKIIPPADGDDPASREILWDIDLRYIGNTGAVLFAPLPEFVWGREIDIVSIRVSKDNSGDNVAMYLNAGGASEGAGTDWDSLPIGLPGDADPPEPDAVAKIRCGHQFPSNPMRAWLEITKLSGPTRGGISHRGTDRIIIGFAQRAKWIQKRSLYPENKIRVSSLEGMDWHLDRFMLDNPPFIEDKTYPAMTGLLPPASSKKLRSFIKLDSNRSLPDTDRWALSYEYVRGKTMGGSEGGLKDGMMTSDKFVINNKKPSKLFMECIFDLQAVVVTASGDNDADARRYGIADLGTLWRFIAIASVNQNGRYVPEAGRHGETQGCYGNNLFVSRIGNRALPIFPAADDVPLILKEYPDKLHDDGTEPTHEKWSTK